MPKVHVSDLYVPDRPLLGAEAFNFKRTIGTMRRFITSAPIDDHLNICVSGGWGTGKTSLLKSLLEILDKPLDTEPDPPGTKYVTIWFEPWKLASEEEVRNALARAVLEAIQNDSSFATHVNMDVERRSVLRMLSERFFQVNPDDVSATYKAETRTRETFVEVEEIFHRIANVYLRDPDQPRRIVIAVDDLDRCRPERVTEMLESIKLFFDLPGLIFVVALDERQLLRSIKVDYKMKEGEAGEYVEKIFQLKIPLPRKRMSDLRVFLNANLTQVGVKLENERISSAIIEQYGRNLRNLKLFTNWFSFQRQLIGEVESIAEDALFRWLYLDLTMGRSMTAALKAGSLNLIHALEFLAHGGFLHDTQLREKYEVQLGASPRNYVALIVYATISASESGVEMPTPNLQVTQKEIVDALSADGELAPTLKVMREGNELLIDADLSRIVGQTRSEDIAGANEDATDFGTEPAAKSFSMANVDGPPLAREGILSPQEWNRLGDKLLSAQRLADAYLCYLLAALMDPTEAAYICDMARIFVRTQRLDASKELLARAFELGPTSHYVLSEVAVFFDVVLKDEDLGSLLYREAIVQGNRNPNVPYYLAMNLREDGRHRDAYLAALDAFVLDTDDETKRSMLDQYGRSAGVRESAGSSSREDLEAELATAREAGEYPLRLSESEKEEIRARVTTRPEASATAAQLSRPPF